jgi:SAM-dependent methyltransferase
MKLKSAIHQIQKRSKWLTIAAHVYSNYRAGRRFSSGDVASSAGTTHSNFNLAQSLGYIQRVYSDYLRYGNLGAQSLIGKTVLEVGPGDNLGVALCFIADGVEKVVCLDKFLSNRDSEQELVIYKALRETLSPAGQARFDEAVDLQNGLRFKSKRIEYIYGTGLEDATQIFPAASFDYIVSRAVIMEIPPIDAAMDSMNTLLAPGGKMLHEVDFRDIGFFQSESFHPLEFLTLPDTIHHWMSSNTSRPNLRFLNYYRDTFEKFGYRTQFWITEVLGTRQHFTNYKETIVLGKDYDSNTLDLIRRIRPRMNKRFRDIPEQDLLVSGVFLVVQKPSV